MSLSSKIVFNLDLIFWSSSVVGVLLVFVAIWFAPVVPLMDLVEWAWQGHVGAEILLSGEPLGHTTFKSWPVPNSLIPGTLVLFGLSGKPFLGAKFVATAYVGLCILVAMEAARLAPRRTKGASALAVLSVGLGSSFMNGYLSFAFGALGVTLAAVGYLSGRIVRPIETALLGILFFFVHAIALAGFSLVVASNAMTQRVRVRHIVALVPAYILFGWYVLAENVLGGETDTFAQVDSDPWRETVRFVLYKAYTFMKLGPYHNLIYDGASDYTRSPLLFWTGVGVNVVWSILAGSFLVSLWCVRSNPDLRPLIFAIAGCVLLFFALPQFISVVINPGERFLTIGVLLGLVLGSRHVPASIVQALGYISLFYLISATSLYKFSTSREELPKELADNRAESLEIAFSHSPARFYYLSMQIDLWELSGAQEIIRFQTGLLKTSSDN